MSSYPQLVLMQITTLAKRAAHNVAAWDRYDAKDLRAIGENAQRAQEDITQLEGCRDMLSSALTLLRRIEKGETLATNDWFDHMVAFEKSLNPAATECECIGNYQRRA